MILDLHGTRHHEVDEKVRRFLNFAELPCQIITGNKIPFVSENLKTSKALKILSEKKMGILVVRDKKNKTIGIVTDGHPEYFFTLDVSDMAEEALLSLIDMPCHFAELREVGPMVDGRDGSVLAYARAMLYWHGKHIYCGRCGQATSVEKMGHQRKCVSTNCGEMHFPRTDPAVIMLIEDGERVLLGRQAIWPEGMYSTLAGFVEPGETIEHATAREVFEEVGIQIGNIRYQHSQPWPFPSSLMLGLYATALTTELNINKDEIDHAQWFTRDELLNFADQGKFLPRQLSISRRLIDDWLYQRHD